MTAYTGAGTTFAGAMSQYFVVMTDDHLCEGLMSGSNQAPVGRRSGFTQGATRFRGPSSHRMIPRSGFATD